MTALILLSDWQKSQIEFWRPVQGFEGYDVSSFGRVRSYWHRGGIGVGYVLCPQRIPTMLQFGTHRQGYLTTYLYRKDAKRRTLMLHRVVAEAFIGNPNQLPQVNHITGYKADARKDGLEWVNQHENMAHAFRVGLKTRKPKKLKTVDKRLGRKTWHRLSDEEVRKIRILATFSAATQKELALRFSIDPSDVSRIVHRKRYGYVT